MCIFMGRWPEANKRFVIVIVTIDKYLFKRYFLFILKTLQSYVFVGYGLAEVLKMR